MLSPASGPRPIQTTRRGVRGAVVPDRLGVPVRPRARRGEVRRSRTCRNPGEGGQRVRICRFVHCTKMSEAAGHRRRAAASRDGSVPGRCRDGRRRRGSRRARKSYGRVRISAPSLVTSRVCSNCALRPPVGGDDGPAVVPHHPLVGAEIEHRLDRERHARPDLVVEPRVVVVRDDQPAVERRPDAVTGELADHAVPEPLRVGLDDAADDVDPSPRLDGVDRPLAAPRACARRAVGSPRRRRRRGRSRWCRRGRRRGTP